MMTSLGSDRARGTRDKVLPTTTQTTQPQKQLQATAEQIRLAQMIYDKNDADFEDKVNQLMEVTGKNQDECMIALHDCNEDVNRAINFLLEGTSDTVEKKKNFQKHFKQAILNVSPDEQEVRTRTHAHSSILFTLLACCFHVTRLRVLVLTASGGRGRGRAPGTSRFTAQGMGTFNPADYTSDGGTTNSHADVWESGANDATDGTGERRALKHSLAFLAWRSTLEDWAAEDWSEDLSETKVFTSSCARPAENHITPGQSLDLASLLQKPAGREELGSLKPASAQGLSHSLVFTNSHHQPTRNGGPTTGTTSYAHATLVSPWQGGLESSVLGSGFGELGGPKLGQTAGQQILEQLKAPGLGQLTSQPPSTGTSCAPGGGLPGTGISVPSSSWDIKPQSSASLSSQFREFKMQPEPSLVLSQLSQRQPSSLSHSGPLPLAGQASSPPLTGATPPQGSLEGFSKAPEPSHPPLTVVQPADPQASSTQHRQMKTQKRRIPPTSKIPSSAVEMPGSTDVSGLNVQFGALDFGSESPMPDFSQPENCNSESTREATAVSQTQSSLYSKPMRCVSRETCIWLLTKACVLILLRTVALRLLLCADLDSPCCSAGKAPPNLSQGVPPLLPNQYIMGPGGLLPAYPQIYGYEDLHMLQSRLPMDYYGITFPGPTATLSSRDGSLANNPYSGEVTKFGRGDSTSPAPPTSLQGQSQPQPQGHHSAQQAFLNPALPPGYSYTGLPYYPGVPGVPSAFQYGPTMFVPPASAKQHGMGLNNPSTPFQQPSGYGQHTFSSGYDDLTQGPAGAEYSKGYNNSSQPQAKSAASGPGKGVSVTSSNSGVPDISGTVYNKTQSFDKQGFHAGTPPPFNLPSALGGTGPLTPSGAPGYAPAPFLHILPAHQQPHSQLLHHHLTQDGQGGPSQRSQTSTMQQKTQVNKSSYGSSPYWGN
uniref:UBA domain-containing protein n=1 Tax=Electrophorus electricus TaxID=8005 RepID=A0A4W4G5A9_ELEEL